MLFRIIEYVVLLALLILYVIPNWGIRKTLSFTDLLVLEMFFFIFTDLYKRNKKKWKRN